MIAAVRYLGTRTRTHTKVTHAHKHSFPSFVTATGNGEGTRGHKCAVGSLRAGPASVNGTNDGVCIGNRLVQVSASFDTAVTHDHFGDCVDQHLSFPASQSSQQESSKDKSSVWWCVKAPDPSLRWWCKGETMRATTSRGLGCSGPCQQMDQKHSSVRLGCQCSQNC